jgi:hypothetical protein
MVDEARFGGKPMLFLICIYLYFTSKSYVISLPNELQHLATIGSRKSKHIYWRVIYLDIECKLYTHV